MLGITSSNYHSCKIICLMSAFVIFFSHNFVFSELIPFYPCSFTRSSSCEILNVTANPCPEVENNEPCNHYRGTNISLTIFFKPNFNGKKLKVQRYSVVLVLDVIDFTYHDNEACLFTTPSCPVTAGETYKFHQNMSILDSYPPGVYTAKWKIWNEENPLDECCFKSTVAVV